MFLSGIWLQSIIQVLIILYFVPIRYLLQDIKSFWEKCIPETRKFINPRYFIPISNSYRTMSAPRRSGRVAKARVERRYCGMLMRIAKDMTVLRRDLLPCFMEKKRFQQKPSLFLFFIVPQFHVKTLWNWRFCFLIIFASKKKNWLMVSWF